MSRPDLGQRGQLAPLFERALGTHLEPLGPLLTRRDVSEILLNGPDTVFVEVGGRLERTQLRLPPEQLEAALRLVAQYAGRAWDAEHPILEAQLPSGSRLEAVRAPIAENGPVVSIRKHQLSALKLETLVERGCLSGAAVNYLRAGSLRGYNVLISGGTGTGKTSVLRALTELIPESERLVVLEDSRELMLGRPHVVSLESRPADERGQGLVSLRELLRASLRLRPDRILLGEVRGAEALELVMALNTGHGGALSTIHASSPEGALFRLETLALSADCELPLTALRAQIAAAIQLILQLKRLHDGRRVVTEIVRVLPLSPDGQYQLRTLFRRKSEAGSGPNTAHAFRAAAPPEPEQLPSAGVAALAAGGPGV